MKTSLGLSPKAGRPGRRYRTVFWGQSRRNSQNGTALCTCPRSSIVAEPAVLPLRRETTESGHEKETFETTFVIYIKNKILTEVRDSDDRRKAKD